MFYDSFPNELNEDLREVLKIIPPKTYYNCSAFCTENVIVYSLDNCMVKFPYRIYFMEPDIEKLNELTDMQKVILYCIYTRSCDGYVREKYVKKLLSLDFGYWAIPFIVKLCDEYVIEILEVIYHKLKDRNNSDIKNFCLENKAVINKSYSRMISYWNEFYRDREYNFRNYIGRKLFRECLGYDRTFER